MGRGIFQSTMEQIEAGRSGKIQAVPTSLPKYNQFAYGTRQKCYYLYGGETGTGKTRLAREQHIYEFYDYYKQVNDARKLDVNFLDFSLEMSAQENMACAISRRLYLDRGIVCSPENILSIHGKLSDEIYEAIKEYRPYFEDFEKKLTVIEEDITPNKFHDILMAYALKVGKFRVQGKYISECQDYVPNNPNMYHIILFDTVNLAELDSGHENIKSSIDRISRIAVWFRNKCGFTFVIVQQFNSEISATDRARYGIRTPLLRDFEDSKRTTKDANVVFGLFDATRHMKEEEKLFMGYDISIMKSWFRSLHLLKHRGGQSNKVIPLQYKGAVGIFQQLPEVKDMDERQYTLHTRY